VRKRSFDLLFLVIFLLPFVVRAAEPSSSPRTDLYLKIKKETGVSLQEAFQASEGKSSSAVTGLQIYAKRVGIKDIEKAYEDEIAGREQYCKKNNVISCDETVRDLKAQITFIRDLNSKANSLDAYKKLYLNLVLYHFNIKLKVLKKDLLEWENDCSSQEKINTKPCQVKLYETHVLADIARDVSQIALMKAEKLPLNEELLKSIKERVSRYAQ